MRVITIVRAVSARILFAGHALISLLETKRRLKGQWTNYMFFVLIGQLLEGIVYSARHDIETTAVCPVVGYYLLVVVTSFWIRAVFLEEQGLAYKRTYGHHKGLTNCSEPYNLVGNRFTLFSQTHVVERTLDIKPDLEQELQRQYLMLGLLILGRWLLPRGKMSKDQLSRLLLIQIGIVGDIADFFTSLGDDYVQCNRPLLFLVLTIWTLSLVPFIFVFPSSSTESKKQNIVERFKERNKDIEKNILFHPEVGATVVLMILQDIPFLVVRLVLTFKYNQFDDDTTFFIFKNSLLIILGVSRLYFLTTDIQKIRQRRQMTSDSATVLRLLQGPKRTPTLVGLVGQIKRLSLRTSHSKVRPAISPEKQHPTSSVKKALLKRFGLLNLGKNKPATSNSVKAVTEDEEGNKPSPHDKPTTGRQAEGSENASFGKPVVTKSVSSIGSKRNVSQTGVSQSKTSAEDSQSKVHLQVPRFSLTKQSGGSASTITTDYSSTTINPESGTTLYSTSDWSITGSSCTGSEQDGDSATGSGQEGGSATGSGQEGGSSISSGSSSMSTADSESDLGKNSNALKTAPVSDAAYNTKHTSFSVMDSQKPSTSGLAINPNTPSQTSVLSTTESTHLLQEETVLEPGSSCPLAARQNRSNNMQDATRYRSLEKSDKLLKSDSRQLLRMTTTQSFASGDVTTRSSATRRFATRYAPQAKPSAVPLPSDQSTNEQRVVGMGTARSCLCSHLEPSFGRGHFAYPYGQRQFGHPNSRGHDEQWVGRSESGHSVRKEIQTSGWHIGTHKVVNGTRDKNTPRKALPFSTADFTGHRQEPLLASSENQVSNIGDPEHFTQLGSWDAWALVDSGPLVNVEQTQTLSMDETSTVQDLSDTLSSQGPNVRSEKRVTFTDTAPPRTEAEPVQDTPDEGGTAVSPSSVCIVPFPLEPTITVSSKSGQPQSRNGTDSKESQAACAIFSMDSKSVPSRLEVKESAVIPTAVSVQNVDQGSQPDEQERRRQSVQQSEISISNLEEKEPDMTSASEIREKKKRRRRWLSPMRRILRTLRRVFGRKPAQKQTEIRHPTSCSELSSTSSEAMVEEKTSSGVVTSVDVHKPETEVTSANQPGGSGSPRPVEENSIQADQFKPAGITETIPSADGHIRYPNAPVLVRRISTHSMSSDSTVSDKSFPGNSITFACSEETTGVSELSNKKDAVMDDKATDKPRISKSPVPAKRNRLPDKSHQKEVSKELDQISCTPNTFGQTSINGQQTDPLYSDVSNRFSKPIAPASQESGESSWAEWTEQRWYSLSSAPSSSTQDSSGFFVVPARAQERLSLRNTILENHEEMSTNGSLSQSSPVPPFCHPSGARCKASAANLPQPESVRVGKIQSTVDTPRYSERTNAVRTQCTPDRHTHTPSICQFSARLIAWTSEKEQSARAVEKSGPVCNKQESNLGFRGAQRDESFTRTEEASTQTESPEFSSSFSRQATSTKTGEGSTGENSFASMEVSSTLEGPKPRTSFLRQFIPKAEPSTESTIGRSTPRDSFLQSRGGRSTAPSSRPRIGNSCTKRVSEGLSQSFSESDSQSMIGLLTNPGVTNAFRLLLEEKEEEMPPHLRFESRVGVQTPVKFDSSEGEESLT